jgi:cytochrome c-type biogenesis protein
MLETTATVGFATAFLAGVISFLSPCVLPLVPGYLSYVAGTSLEELRDRAESRLKALGFALCFVLGFSAVFVALGASATALGGLLLQYKTELSLLAGALILLFGLHLAGVLPLGWLQREARVHLDVPGGRAAGAFLMGLAFAFGWTPCIGPVLGAILTMSASTADIGAGTALLAVYSLGLGLPFLAAALFTDVLLARLRSLSRAGRNLQRAAGAALAVVGVLILTGRLEAMAYWLLETFPALARVG